MPFIINLSCVFLKVQFFGMSLYSLTPERKPPYNRYLQTYSNLGNVSGTMRFISLPLTQYGMSASSTHCFATSLKSASFNVFHDILPLRPKLYLPSSATESIPVYVEKEIGSPLKEYSSIAMSLSPLELVDFLSEPLDFLEQQIDNLGLFYA